MQKAQSSFLALLLLLLAFLLIVFFSQKQKFTPASIPTATTLPPTTTSSPTATTTQQTTILPTTTTETSMCEGTNKRVCSYGTKYDCSISKCCYWDEEISKCRPKPCSSLTEETCVLCGCSLQ